MDIDGSNRIRIPGSTLHQARPADWIDNKTEFEYNNYNIKNNTLYFKNIIKHALVRLNNDGKEQCKLNYKI